VDGQDWTVNAGHAKRDKQNRIGRTEQTEQDRQKGLVELERQNKTGRTVQQDSRITARQGCQDINARTTGQEDQDSKTNRKELPGMAANTGLRRHDCEDCRTDRTGQAELVNRTR
jgi:hypothetical protein